MSPQVDLRLAELLCARLCHELVSPVGAINNGVELLSEDEADFLKDAVSLIGQSARKAGQRLQFYRMAYGASVGASVSGGDPADLLAGLFEGGRTGLNWQPEANALPRDWQRLACNLAVLVAEFLPRGGTVTVAMKDSSSANPAIIVGGEGAALNPLEEMAEGLAGGIANPDLTTRNVHAAFTSGLAEYLGARVTVEKINANSFALIAE